MILAIERGVKVKAVISASTYVFILGRIFIKTGSVTLGVSDGEDLP